MGGWVPFQMGQYLGLRLKPGSDVRLWYSMLTPEWTAWMKLHYVNFMNAVKTYYLGERWQQERDFEYSQQYFRQPGHHRETPMEFIQRRLLYTRMLLYTPIGGQEEVRAIMAKAPISWKMILFIEGVRSVMELQVKVQETSDQLLESWRSRAAGADPRRARPACRRSETGRSGSRCPSGTRGPYPALDSA